MSEIGGSGSEVGGGSEVSSSEVSEAPAAETGGDASEATQEAANEQANESGGFEDDETETTMEDDESDEDVSDMDEESDESQNVGFEDSEGVDNTDDNPEDSDVDNNEETEMSDEDKVGFDDEEEFDAEESVEEENSTDDIDPLNEDSDDSDNSEHEDYLDDEDNIEDNDDSEDEDLLEEDTGESEEYSDETEEEPEEQTEDTDAELEESEADEDGEADDDHIDETETEDEAEEQTEDTDAELEDNEADEDGEGDDDHIDETETEDEAEDTDAELEESEADEDGEADDDHIDETETEDEAEEQTEDTDAELEDNEADEDGEADDDHIDETETEDEAEEQTDDTDAELEESEADEDGEVDDDHIDETETEDEAEEQTDDTDAELEDNEADEDGDPEGDRLDAQYEEDEAEDDEYIEDEYDEEEDPGDIEQYTEDSDEREEETSETDEEDNDEDEDDERELEEINEEAAEQVEQEAIENNAEDNIKNETEIAEDENKKVAEDVPDTDESSEENNVSSDEKNAQDASDPNNHTSAEVKLTQKNTEKWASERSKLDADNGGNSAQEIKERIESSGKYSPEYNALRHANAKGEEAYKEALESGKTPEEANSIKDDTIKNTYIDHRGERAYNDEIKNSGDEKKAEEARAHERSVAEEIAGNVEDLKPGSEYYNRYEELSKTDSTILHGEKVDENLNAVGSQMGRDASGVYSTGESVKTPAENIRERALPKTNDADKEYTVEINPKTNDGREVYAMHNTVGAQNHQRFDKESPFYNPNQKLDGGAEQVVLSTSGRYDGSATVKPSSENSFANHNEGKNQSSEVTDEETVQVGIENEAENDLLFDEYEEDPGEIEEYDEEFDSPNPNDSETVDANEKISPESNNEVDKAEIEKIKNESFLTNDGERVTYQEAVDRVTGKAEEYMKDMGVSDDKISEVKADMEQELYKQEIEARSRGIGDHGIRHIYGNAERGEQYLSSRDDVSSEQKLGVLVAQTYHDEGYSLKNDKVDNSGVLHGGADKKHDEASLDVWNSKKEMYSDVLSKDTMASVDKAIGEHNIGSSDKLAVNEESGIAEKTGKYDKNNEEDKKVIEAGEEDGRAKIKENTSSDADVVVSTVHISDKLALSEREKFSDALLKEPKLVELTEGMNSTMKSMSNEKLGFYDSNGKMTEQGKELLDKYHNQINDYIDSKYSEPDASRMKTAVEKDIGFNSGKFSSRMNYIYTPSDCYKYNPETKTNEITVYKIDHGDAKSSDLQNEQLDKLFDDLGLDKNEREDAIKQGGFEDKERGLSVHVETKTVDEIKAIEAEKYQENNDLKETNERIDAGREQYQELNNKFLEVAETLEAEDINYDDYDKMCRACNKSDGCSKSEFEGKTDTDRKKLVNEAMSEMVLTQVSNTLGKEELK